MVPIAGFVLTPNRTVSNKSNGVGCGSKNDPVDPASMGDREEAPEVPILEALDLPDCKGPEAVI
ncbi:MAG: hypothetical protein ACREK4_12190, partial [Candidatus Rokuibacteriota bacterium]